MAEFLRLDGGGETLLLQLAQGRPALAYWGPALPAGAEGRLDGALFERAVPHGMLDAGEAFDLFPEAGHGFTGQPALVLARPGGAFITQTQVTAVTSAAGEAILTLSDPAAAVEAAMTLRLDAATGVLSVRTEVRNTGDGALRLDWVSPCALPSHDDEILSFGGRWSREFAQARQTLPQGLWASESRTGRTSHHAPPFAVIGEPGFGEHHGRLIGVHLAWSGDHRLLAERLRDGRLQIQAGELFWPGEAVLAPGETYRTPWLHAARSRAGLNGLSDRLHPFVRSTVMGGRLAGRPRPVHFNTWEAVYFRHDETELRALADLAAEAGAERFVLDDGWFRGRDDDTRALGDWTPDPAKYPRGLGPLAAHVRGLGMAFGLWLEPEMANADSDLLRAHPDWILGAPGRRQPLGRGQYVLDLSRPEVADAIFDQIHRLLREVPIGYLKWDMNRDLTHPASGGRPAARRQVEAVYGLMDRVRAAHPSVEIESCASGGGRADYAVLTRCDRIWTSDCNDPLERQSIQRGFSIFFPPEVMGAHVGPADSHTTARWSSLELRALTALFGHMGIEADVRRFPAEDRAALAQAIALHKAHRALLHGGRLVRQVHPDPGLTAFLVTNGVEALVSAAQVETPRHAAPAPLRLEGLAPDAVYGVRLLNPPGRPRAAMKRTPALAAGQTITASGRLLVETGLPLPVLRAGEIAVFHLAAEAGT